MLLTLPEPFNSTKARKWEEFKVQGTLLTAVEKDYFHHFKVKTATLLNL